jgi:parallel beta-helix repeat protein
MFPLVALFIPTAHATTYYVTAGDDVTLAMVLSTSAPGSLIVIDQPPGTGSATFTLPVILNPNNSQTKLMAAPGVSAIWDVSGDVFTVTSNTLDVVLENLVITGDSSGSGIEVQHYARVKVINDQITAKIKGIHVGSMGGIGPGGLAEIEGSRIFNTNYGILIDGVYGSRATVERTQIRNNDWGILLTDQTNQIKVWHSIVDGNRSYGVYVSRDNSAVLNNNDISFNIDTGIYFEEGARGSVSFNTVTFNLAYGIYNGSGVNVNANPGNNTVAGNPSGNVVGLPVASNQIGPW